MVPPLLFDLTGIDLEQVVFDVDAIERVNPHRGAMRMLDGIHYIDEGYSHAVAYKDVRDDEFWVEGHIPGRPIMPGVLMLEAAAQLASFLLLQRIEKEEFFGFVGLNDVKFRAQVVPGDRLVILGKEVKFRPKRLVCDAQGLVRGAVVFEARILGMPM